MRAGERAHNERMKGHFDPVGFVERHGIVLASGKGPVPNVADTIAGGLMFAGTPDQVYDQVVDFYQAIGGFGHFLMMTQAGQMEHADTVDSMALFAREVMPRLQDFHATAQLAA